MTNDLNLEKIDLDDFIDLLPKQELLDDYTKVSYSSLVGFKHPNFNMGDNSPIHDTLIAQVVYGDKTTVVRASLQNEALEGNLFDPTLKDIAEQHRNNQGNPTHLVQVSNGLVMAANPEDFKLMYSDDGAYGLLLLAQVRTRVYSL